MTVQGEHPAKYSHQCKNLAQIFSVAASAGFVAKSLLPVGLIFTALPPRPHPQKKSLFNCKT